MSTEVIPQQCSPSNLRLALDAYEAEQQRQAALAEAQRIGHLIHLQEQQLVAARQLARQRKNNALRRQQQLHQVSMMEVLPECAIEEEEDTESSSTSSGQSASRSSTRVTARRNNRVVSKRRSKRVSSPSSSLHAAASSSSSTSIPSITPTEPQPAGQTLPHSQPLPLPLPLPPSQPRSHHHPNVDQAAADGIKSNATTNTVRFADWKRRPQEPSAHLCPRSLWKPDSHTTRCDNILCRTPFAIWNGTKRHHCRRCGNVFCDACTSRTQVLYDMTKLPWDIIPEILLASLFKASDDEEGDEEEQEGSVVDSTRATPELKSPSASSLSSSFESGSSFGSQSYFEPRPTLSASKKVLWELGSDYAIPMHLRMAVRDQVLDCANPERVCDDCHDRLWGRDTPTDRYYDRRALQIERDEIAWALTVQGLEKWDDCLRSFGLTLKPTVSDRREMRRAARRGSNVSNNTTTTTESGVSQISSSSSSTSSDDKKATAASASCHIATDYLNRPVDTRMYAWPTPPPFIRFTTRALMPSPPSPPRYQPDPEPSIFGALKANPKYLPTRPMPPPPPPHIPTEEEKEKDRQARYAKAIEKFIYDAYEAAELLGPEFQRKCRVIMPRPLEWHQELKDDLWRYAVDAMSWWRGDSYGGWH